MRKNYYSPATEVLKVNATWALCEVASAGIGLGGGTEIVDPGMGG